MSSRIETRTSKNKCTSDLKLMEKLFSHENIKFMIKLGKLNNQIFEVFLSALLLSCLSHLFSDNLMEIIQILLENFDNINQM